MVQQMLPESVYEAEKLIKLDDHVTAHDWKALSTRERTFSSTLIQAVQREYTFQVIILINN